jgi:hypothetical protein
MIEQFRAELGWLRQVAAELDRRAPAAHPARLGKDMP